MDLLSATILLVTVGIGVTCSVLRLLVILDSDTAVEACIGMFVDTMDRLKSGLGVEVVVRCVDGRIVVLPAVALGNPGPPIDQGLGGLTIVIFELATRFRPQLVYAP